VGRILVSIKAMYQLSEYVDDRLSAYSARWIIAKSDVWQEGRCKESASRLAGDVVSRTATYLLRLLSGYLKS